MKKIKKMHFFIMLVKEWKYDYPTWLRQTLLGGAVYVYNTANISYPALFSHLLQDLA